MNIVYILLALLLLGILVTVHEFGHFIAARLTGIAVREFSIGFGTKLIGWKSKKYETTFAVRLLPLGGYCAFYGEDDATGKEQEDPRAFPLQKVWKRILTVLSGPLMNFVLAFLVAIGYMLAYSGNVTDYYVSQINNPSPAMSAGFEAGDILWAVNDENVCDGTYTTFSGKIGAWREEDGPLTIEVKRNDEIVALSLIPEYIPESNAYMIGITMAAHVIPLSIGEAIPYSFRFCVQAGSAIFESLKNLVTKGEGLNDMAGPVGIISLISQETTTGGLANYLYLLIFISINLGIMNLLPIPGLDGSRILFMLLEIVRGKPIPQKKEAIVHLIGFGLLFALMIFLTFKDVIRLFG